MEHGEEDGSLDVELIAASLQELLDNVLASGLSPEPLKDQCGADAVSVYPSGDGSSFSEAGLFR
jgi:hypothetical protein